MPHLREAQRRHAAYYYSVLDRANKLYRPEGTNPLRGLELYDREAENIHRAQIWTTQHAANDKIAAKLCGRFLWTGGDLLGIRLHANDYLSWAEAGRNAALMLTDQTAVAVNLGLIGLAHVSLGNLRQAVSVYNDELAIVRALGNSKLEAGAYSRMGYAYQELGEIPRAIDCYEKAIKMFCASGDHDAESRVYSNLAISYESLGRTEEALDIHRRAVGFYRKTGERRSEAVTLGNMANVHDSLGRTELAIQLINDALTIFREIKFRVAEGQALGSLGRLYSKMGEKQRALQYLDEALKIARETQDRGGEASVLGTTGQVYGGLGDTERAIDYLNEQLSIAREISDGTSEANALASLGHVYQRTGDSASALEFYKGARLVAIRVGNFKSEIDTICKQANIYESRGDLATARQLYERQLRIARVNSHADMEVHAIDHLARTYVESDRPRALAIYKQQLTFCLAKGDWHGEARIHKLLGMMLEGFGEREAAVKHAQSAVAIFEANRDFSCAQEVRGQLSSWSVPNPVSKSSSNSSD